jgi:branched-chain amino acid transport system permease protein
MMNFALGEWAMLGSRLAAAGAHAGLGPVAGLVGGCVVMVALGAAFSRVVLRRLVGRPLLALIMVTLGLGALVRGAAPIGLRGLPAGLALPMPTDPLLVHGVLVPADKLVAAVVAAVAVALVTAWFRWSRSGLALRAIADDQQVALAVGIDVQRHLALAWAVVGVLAVLGGVLWAGVAGGGLGVVVVGLRVFPIVVLGGLDSVGGSLAAALLLGVFESLAASYLDPHLGAGFSSVASYALLLAVLFVRPHGLFGRPQVARV